MSQFIFEATLRTELGKGASRRLRRNGDIPAIIYGGDKAPVSVVLNHNKVLNAFRDEAVYSSVLTIEVNGEKEAVVLCNVQRHAFKPLIQHLDFMRVNANEVLTKVVPVHLLNEDKAPGVKLGGVLTHQLNTVEVECLPSNLPTAIELDVSALEIDQHITVAQLPAINGVTYITPTDEIVVSVLHQQIGEEAEETTEA